MLRVTPSPCIRQYRFLMSSWAGTIYSIWQLSYILFQYTDSVGNIIFKICKTLFSEKRKQKLCIKRTCLSFSFSVSLRNLAYVKWFATTGQLFKGEHPVSRGEGFVVLFRMFKMQWFWLDFRKQKRRAESTFICTPFSLLVVNEGLMTMNKGRMWATEQESRAL